MYKTPASILCGSLKYLDSISKIIMYNKIYNFSSNLVKIRAELSMNYQYVYYSEEEFDDIQTHYDGKVEYDIEA